MWLQYSFQTGIPIWHYMRLTSEEQNVLALVETGGHFLGAGPHLEAQIRKMVGDEVFDQTLAKLLQAQEAAAKGHIVVACVLDDWLPPLDDIV